MATQTKTKSTTASGFQMPDGFTKRDTFAARMEIEAGLWFVGVLGAIQPSKKAGFKDYRYVRVTESNALAPGLYFLPTHAALQCLMDEANGTQVVCHLQGGSGETDDPYIWEVGVKG